MCRHVEIKVLVRPFIRVGELYRDSCFFIACVSMLFLKDDLCKFV